MIDGIINNGEKEPTVAELEQQARSGQPISLMDLAAAAHREEREKKKSEFFQFISKDSCKIKLTLRGWNCIAVFIAWCFDCDVFE